MCPLSCQDLMTAGYLLLHFPASASRFTSASFLVAALYTGFNSLKNAFRSFVGTYFSELRIWCTTQLCTSVLGKKALDGLLKARELIKAGNEPVFQPAVV